MAADDTVIERLGENSGLQWAQVKGTLFEMTLLASTLAGIISVLILFGYTAFDAFRPLTASSQWYLLYFATLVAPTAAFTLYARRNPPIRVVNARAFAVIFGGLAISLVTYILADAVSPYDVLIYVIFASIPPILVYTYARTTGNWTYAGPAIPTSLVVGIAVTGVLYGFIRPFVGILASWIAYAGFTTVPVAILLGIVVTRRWSRRHAGIVVAGILAGLGGVVGASLATGRNPALWIVLYSGFVVPVCYVLGETIITNKEGRIGVLGPFVLAGGILVGAVLERQLGIQGLDGYFTPSLLLNSWNGLDASGAGIYPQLVGLILIVTFMAVLSFPVGISAAVYLEEYAPNTGWRGRFATLVEVNISNLAGVPSVVYGLLGLALFRNTFGFGTGIVISAAGTLGLLILPIVVVSTQEALRSVPDSLRDASYGMGASRWQTLRNVVFPEAIPGTLTGIILAVARAIGETAPLVIIAVATTKFSPPDGLFASATALPLQIFAARSNVDAAFRHGILPAAAIVLLLLMLVMNATAIVIRNKYERGS